MHTFVVMHRKSINIFFLFLAFFIQLGHSVIPHAHHLEHIHDGTHHHQDDEHSEENGWMVFFVHFNHSSETFSNSQLEDLVKVVKEVTHPDLVLHSIVTWIPFAEYDHKNERSFNQEPLIFISPHLHSLHFRGPPTLFS